MHQTSADRHVCMCVCIFVYCALNTVKLAHANIPRDNSNGNADDNSDDDNDEDSATGDCFLLFYL